MHPTVPGTPDGYPLPAICQTPNTRSRQVSQDAALPRSWDSDFGYCPSCGERANEIAAKPVEDGDADANELTFQCSNPRCATRWIEIVRGC